MEVFYISNEDATVNENVTKQKIRSQNTTTLRENETGWPPFHRRVRKQNVNSYLCGFDNNNNNNNNNKNNSNNNNNKEIYFTSHLTVSVNICQFSSG